MILWEGGDMHGICFGLLKMCNFTTERVGLVIEWIVTIQVALGRVREVVVQVNVIERGWIGDGAVLVNANTREIFNIAVELAVSSYCRRMIKNRTYGQVVTVAVTALNILFGNIQIEVAYIIDGSSAGGIIYNAVLTRCCLGGVEGMILLLLGRTFLGNI